MVDYAGQRLAENIYAFLTVFFGAIGFVYGYIKQDFRMTVYGWSIGLGLSLLICIPDWPIFNRKPVVWLEKVGQYKQQQSKASSSSSSSASKAKDTPKEKEVTTKEKEGTTKDGKSKKN